MCWTLVTAAPAAAHAELTRSTPAQAPTSTARRIQVVLVFSDAVTPMDGGIRLLDRRGRNVAEPQPQPDPGDPDTVRVAMPDLGDGVYAVTWRVASGDTHAVRGRLAFTVGAATNTRLILRSRLHAASARCIDRLT